MDRGQDMTEDVDARIKFLRERAKTLREEARQLDKEARDLRVKSPKEWEPRETGHYRVEQIRTELIDFMCLDRFNIERTSMVNVARFAVLFVKQTTIGYVLIPQKLKEELQAELDQIKALRRKNTESRVRSLYQNKSNEERDEIIERSIQEINLDKLSVADFGYLLKDWNKVALLSHVGKVTYVPTTDDEFAYDKLMWNKEGWQALWDETFHPALKARGYMPEN